MIDTNVRGMVPEGFTADHGSAMSAAIDEDMKRAILITRDDDRCVSDKGCFKITRLGHLRLQANITPGTASENPFLFHLVNRWIGEDLIRHPVDLCGPAESDRLIHMQAAHDFLLRLKSTKLLIASALTRAVTFEANIRKL